MKKIYFFLAALTGLALVSCSDNSVVGDEAARLNAGEGQAISFSGANGALTRGYTAAESADLLNKNFVVLGVKSNGTLSNDNPVFDHYNVDWVTNTANTTTSNTNDWEYVGIAKHALANAENAALQSIKYWDYAKSQYDFVAFSAGKGNTAVYTGTPTDGQVKISKVDVTKLNGVDSDTDGKIDQGAYTIEGKAADLAKVYIADLITAYRADNDYQNVVRFNFRSLSAKVRVALYETVPGYSVKDVVFYNAADDATPNATAKLFTTAGSTDVFNNAGTYVVYYPTTGYANKTATDYNKAHLSFIPAASEGTDTKMSFGALTGSLDAATLAGKEFAEATGNYYLGRSSDKATYAGAKADNYYTVVIPNETGAVLNLKVNYTLVSTDGSGEVINVTGATAKVPAVYAAWKSGYAYTYIFKISQNTNGTTGTGPAGLYPITFDAVVTETEDGVQETITTVATPSITTYSKGAVVTTTNEYKKSSNIYFIVDGATLSASNAKIYKITLDEGAAQTINEASVANLLAHGTNTGGTWTVTDALGKNMTASQVGISFPGKIDAADAPDGNEITVNCALFNTTVAGTYAFEYTDGSSNKYYKIVKVVN